MTDRECKCPRCGHTWIVEPTWRAFLKKKPGHKIHFFSNRGSVDDPLVQRTRLHYGLDVDFSIIEASLTMVQLDHRDDTFFRWTDCATGTIDEVIKNLQRR